MTDTVPPLVPRRKIEGISAILLPFLPNGEVDWASFDRHVERTASAGLIPAVNMDTGYVNLLDDATRRTVLERTRNVLGNRPFVAGAFVKDEPGARFSVDSYTNRTDEIQRVGGTPVIFQSFGLVEQPGPAIIDCYRRIARRVERFIAFELGKMFAPFGAIYDVETYEQLLSIPNCMGAKHSSLSRALEWKRLERRDRVRPDFRVYTGNDLAIDMVMYGSDYLLGLSTFAPDEFALRDRYWEQGDPRFYELNDLLQYLGFFAFRAPVPAYKHSAAQFLALRGKIAHGLRHPLSPGRPESDVEILADIARRLESWSAAP